MKRFGLSMKVVIRDGQGRCLLLLRGVSSKANPGRWDLPGGKVDPGEVFDAALVREVAEETGLTIRLNGVAGTAQSESPTRRVAYLIMEGQVVSGEVQLSGEHGDFAWVSLPDLPGMNLCDQFKDFARAYAEEHGDE